MDTDDQARSQRKYYLFDQATDHCDNEYSKCFRNELVFRFQYRNSLSNVHLYVWHKYLMLSNNLGR